MCGNVGRGILWGIGSRSAVAGKGQGARGDCACALFRKGL